MSMSKIIIMYLILYHIFQYSPVVGIMLCESWTDNNMYIFKIHID